MQRKKETTSWQNSTPKKLLLQDLRDGTISLDNTMEPRDVYYQRPEFAEFGTLTIGANADYSQE